MARCVPPPERVQPRTAEHPFCPLLVLGLYSQACNELNLDALLVWCVGQFDQLLVPIVAHHIQMDGPAVSHVHLHREFLSDIRQRSLGA